MQVETLRDVLHWTRKFHVNLRECTEHCADLNESERAKLLLNYLSDHEAKLVKVLDEFERTAKINALNTWCYEYIDKKVIKRHELCDAPFEKLSTNEVMLEVSNLHDQVIGLYEHLLGRVTARSARELLEELRSIEQNEAMVLSRDFGRLEDI